MVHNDRYAEPPLAIDATTSRLVYVDPNTGATIGEVGPEVIPTPTNGSAVRVHVAESSIPMPAPMGEHRFNPETVVRADPVNNTSPVQEQETDQKTQAFKREGSQLKVGGKQRKAGFDVDGTYEVESNAAILPHVYGLRSVRYRCECDGSGSKQLSPITGTRLPCLNHLSHCTGRKGRRQFKACITCEMVMCSYCAKTMHKDEDFPDCCALPLTFVHEVQGLYIEHNLHGTLPCEFVIKHASLFRNIDKKNGQFYERAVIIVMKRAMARYGEHYAVKMKEFLDLFSAYIVSLRDPIAKPDDVAANEWNALGPFGQRLLDFQLWWRYRDSKGGLFSRWTRVIEAVRGGNVAQYFAFLHWLIRLNLILSILVIILLILPAVFNKAFAKIVYDWEGVLVGQGMEATPMFYSGYYADYQETTSWRWKMDRIWVPVQIALLIISLVAVMASISTEAMAEGRSNNASQTDQYLGMLLGAIRHSVTDPEEAALNQQLLVVKLDTGLELKHWAKKPAMKGRRGFSWSIGFLCSRYFILGAFSYLLIAAYLGGIYWLVDLAPDDVTESIEAPWNSLSIPVIVAVAKVILPPILKVLALSEFNPNQFSRSFAMSRYYWRILVARVLSLVVMVFSVMRSKPPVIINANPGTLTFPYTYDPTQCTCGGAPATECPSNRMTCVCPEAALGTFYYRLLIVEFLLSIIYSVTLAPLRVVFRSCCSCLRKERRLFSALPYNVSLYRARAKNDLPGRRTQKENPHFVTQKQLEHDNTVNNAFEPLQETADAIYRQTIVWAGAVYAPVLPLMGLIFGMLHYTIKYIEAKYWGRRDYCFQTPARQRLTIQQSLIFVIIVTFIPISYFMTRTSACGPFFYTSVTGDNIGETMVNTFDAFPGWLRIIAGYFTSTVVLWMVIVFILIFVLTMRRQYTVAVSRREDLDFHLYQEIQERNTLVKTLKSVYSAKQRATAENPWTQWINELTAENNDIHRRIREYCVGLTEEEIQMVTLGYETYDEALANIRVLQSSLPDFVDLLRMRDDQLFTHLRNLGFRDQLISQFMSLVSRKRTLRFEQQVLKS